MANKSHHHDSPTPVHVTPPRRRPHACPSCWFIIGILCGGVAVGVAWNSRAPTDTPPDVTAALPAVAARQEAPVPTFDFYERLSQEEVSVPVEAEQTAKPALPPPVIIPPPNTAAELTALAAAHPAPVTAAQAVVATLPVALPSPPVAVAPARPVTVAKRIDNTPMPPVRTVPSPKRIDADHERPHTVKPTPVAVPPPKVSKVEKPAKPVKPTPVAVAVPPPKVGKVEKPAKPVKPTSVAVAVPKVETAAKPAKPVAVNTPKVPKQPASTLVAAEKPAPAAGRGNYRLQLGSFRTQAEAEQLRAALARKGVAVEIHAGYLGGEKSYRLRTGRYDKAGVDALRARLRASGHASVAVEIR